MRELRRSAARPEGPFLLKYFLVDQTTRWQALSHSRFSERAKQTPREIFPSMT